MPIYEYYCSNCGRIFEIEQKITDEPIKRCPECGNPAFKRLISRTHFVLKGGGWYADGYSSTSSAPKKADSGDSSTSQAKKGTDRDV